MTKQEILNYLNKTPNYDLAYELNLVLQNDGRITPDLYRNL